MLALGEPALAHAQPRPAAGTSAEATVVGAYRLQSQIWVNLHQRLMHEARFKSAPPAALSGDDAAAWAQAVDTYRSFLGKRNPIFDDELVALNAALSAAGRDLPAGIPAAAARALAAAMPLYRSAQWESDDRTNRFWIALAAPMLASAGDELTTAHAKVYGTPWPTRILVDVTSHAWEFGAYTVGEGDAAHAVIASTDPGYQGFGALESLMHEPSHAIVGATSAAIGADLTRLSRELGLRPMANLWHAILFYTSGQLTARVLARRGVADYRPMIMGMYDGPFRGFRPSLETHWQAYLDGTITRDAAIREILIETSPTKK